ncbi:MAG: hypothetical protein KIT82_18690 [Bradyrhizobium sp.]|nr:hypothetical protein [Bradyrhizobium sp.]
MKRQLIVGIPESGKSTFIAAMRHLLLSGTLTTELELTRLADEEKHLNDLEQDWLELKEVQRTKPATEGWVEFHVRDKISGKDAVLSVPDLRGETFEQPACSGQCQRELYEAVAGADGLVLFTNAEREDDALMISDLGDLLTDSQAGLEDSGPFDAYGMPEEVKVVEFLQMANRRPLMPKRRRVAVMVSAWDVVPTGTDPQAWFAEKRPMLAQFLVHNFDMWELRVYGVSAQGGRLPADRKRLAKLRNPAERIRLVGHGALPHDLTSPLRWLLNG